MELLLRDAAFVSFEEAAAAPSLGCSGGSLWVNMVYICSLRMMDWRRCFLPYPGEMISLSYYSSLDFVLCGILVERGTDKIDLVNEVRTVE